MRILAMLLFASGISAQEQPLQVKGGHLLGETAEQFFSEGYEKQALDACATGDFRGINKLTKRGMKKYCSQLADTRQQATSARGCEYKGGDLTELRTDTFTFDNGRLVKVELVYAVPSAEANYRGQSFVQIFDGTKQAYGLPTSASTQPVRNQYGVEYVAHRELWLTPQSAVLITERPGEGGSTTLAAFTRAEYDRTVQAATAKAPNPLQ
jgi:hypothetical protein